MSKIMQYIRIRDEELATLRTLLIEDRDGAFEYIDELADGDGEDVPAERSRSLDTDQAWDAIGFLLRRHDGAADAVHGTDIAHGVDVAHGVDAVRGVDVVHGGVRLTDDEWGYEPPRYLSPDQVRHGAARLSAIEFDCLAGRFDPIAMADVYPHTWHDPHTWDRAGALAYLRSWYEHLTAFFGHAAAARDGMIVFLS